MVLYRLIALLISALVLTSCGGGSGNNSYINNQTTITGEFLDSAVKGVTYKTKTQNGITDANGQFKYLDGETIEFYLANSKLGESVGSNILYPDDIDISSAPINRKGLSIARLLQTLDSNNNLNDGIDVSYVSEQAIISASSDKNTTDFVKIYDDTPNSIESFALRILSFHKKEGRSFVSEDDARVHLKKTKDNKLKVASESGSDYDSFQTSKKIILGESYREAIKPKLQDNTIYDNDFFRLNVPESGTLFVKAEGGALTNCYLFNTAKQQLSFDAPQDNQENIINRDCYISHQVSAGTYFIRVFGSASLNPYELEYTLSTGFISSLHQPNINQFSGQNIVSLDANRVQFDWNDFALQYEIQRSTTMHSSFVPLGSKLSTSSYDDTNLVNNQDYYYKLKACDLVGNCSKYSASTVRVSSAFRNAKVINLNQNYSATLNSSTESDLLFLGIKNKGRLDIENIGTNKINCSLYNANEIIIQSEKNILQSANCISIAKNDIKPNSRYYLKVSNDGGSYTINAKLTETDTTKTDQPNIKILNLKKGFTLDNFTPVATGGLGSGAVAVTFSTSVNVAKIENNQINITGLGSVAIAAHKLGDDTYNISESTTFLLTVIKGDQNPITIANISKHTLDENFTPVATGGSGSGAVVATLSSDTAVAKIVNGQVDILKEGVATITAHKLGDDHYLQSNSATFTLTITKQNQNPITIANISKHTLDENFTPVATGGSGSGAVVATLSSDTAVAKIVNGQVDILKEGVATITAHKLGDDHYLQSNSATFVLTIISNVATPNNIKLTASDGEVLIGWDKVSDATGYTLYWRQKIDDPVSAISIDDGKTTSYSHTALTNNTRYYYSISARNNQLESKKSQVYSITPFVSIDRKVVDPLLQYQWHLATSSPTKAYDYLGKVGNVSASNRDKPFLNFPVEWTNATLNGKGINVLVVDDGLDINHKDLSANTSNQSLHCNLNGNLYGVCFNRDPSPVNPANDSHGTMVGGIISAVNNNSIGVSSVAPKSSLGGYNFLKTQSVINQVNALLFNGVDIVNQSYGYSSMLENDIENISIADAYQKGMSLRAGKGIIYVKSAGNSFYRETNSDCTKAIQYQVSCANASNGKTNLNQLIIGALDANDVKSIYSTAGSSILVSAYGGLSVDSNGNVVSKYGILTTHPSGNQTFSSLDIDDIDSSGDYTQFINGTSAATPMVSGAVALMLEVNPNLTWRQVKYILAKTAVKVDENISSVDYTSSNGKVINIRQGWVVNSAGFNYHNWYGFGKVDVSSAINLSADFTSSDYVISLPSTVKSTSYNINQVDSSVVSKTEKIFSKEVADDYLIEEISFYIHIESPNPATNLHITATSPSGTKTTLLNLFNGFTNGNLGNNVYKLNFRANAFYREKSKGVWQISVYNDGSQSATIKSIDAKLFHD